MRQPYLSLVIPTRNDNYPGSKAQHKCLHILQRQLEAAAIESEIIVVDYNPEPAAQPLHEILSVDPGRHVSIRVIRVDEKYHRRFPYWEKRAFHQTCAVNVGLRRSRGRFFVYRAADHIYSEALIRILSRKTLLEDCVYRCDRLDVDGVAIAEASPDDLGALTLLCESHALHRYTPLPVHPYYRIRTLHTNASGDFLLMSRRSWIKVGGLREGRYPLFLDYDSLLLHAARAAGNHQVVLPPDCLVFKANHGMKTTSRRWQEWTAPWKELDRRLCLAGNPAVQTWARIIFNYPRRREKSFEEFLLDSDERHFILPAFLWAHGFPFYQQNIGNWGLKDELLPEHTIATAEWEEPARPPVPAQAAEPERRTPPTQPASDEVSQPYAEAVGANGRSR